MMSQRRHSLCHRRVRAAPKVTDFHPAPGRESGLQFKGKSNLEEF